MVSLKQSKETREESPKPSSKLNTNWPDARQAFSTTSRWSWS